jgi:hypothetical protein
MGDSGRSDRNFQVITIEDKKLSAHRQAGRADRGFGEAQTKNGSQAPVFSQ